MRLKTIIKMFEDGNCCVTGLRGRGKDMLLANVVVRRKLPYVANIDYGGDFSPLDVNVLRCGRNTFRDFLSGNLKHYEYPYPDGTDVYISDAGVYFPAQYCGELNKEFGDIAVFQALSRHVGACNFHFNAQNLNRVWDKIREQSDTYICCLSCHVIFGIVFMKVRIYDKYQSCVDRVPPFSVHLPFTFDGATHKTLKVSIDLQRQTYYCTHGNITTGHLIFRNRSNYNTRYFKEALKNA